MTDEKGFPLAPLAPTIEKHRHLGDGAYAGTDGHHIWLGANHHENMTVALEPDVFAALVRYARDVMGWKVELEDD